MAASDEELELCCDESEATQEMHDLPVSARVLVENSNHCCIVTHHSQVKFLELRVIKCKCCLFNVEFVAINFMSKTLFYGNCP